MAPIILKLEKCPGINVHVWVTAQHSEMLDQVLEVFDIAPDSDLNVMEKDQTLAGLMGRTTLSLEKYLSAGRQDFILVQGHTTTTFVDSLIAFYHRIPVGHAEASFRRRNMKSPWEEEENRVLTSRLFTLHFAPNKLNRENLLGESLAAVKISVTGKTPIDGLFLPVEKVKARPHVMPGIHIPQN